MIAAPVPELKSCRFRSARLIETSRQVAWKRPGEEQFPSADLFLAGSLLLFRRVNAVAKTWFLQQHGMQESPAIDQVTFIAFGLAIPIEHFGTTTHSVDKPVLKTAAVREYTVLLASQHRIKNHVGRLGHPYDVQCVEQIRRVAYAAPAVQKMLKIKVYFHLLTGHWLQVQGDAKIEASETGFLQCLPIA